jgi:hypothetical protein
MQHNSDMASMVGVQHAKGAAGRKTMMQSKHGDSR